MTLQPFLNPLGRLVHRPELCQLRSDKLIQGSKMQVCRYRALLLTASGLWLGGAAASSAWAQLTDVHVFNNALYLQTGPTAPTTPTGYFFNIGGLMQNAGDFTSASASYPNGAAGPNTQPLTIDGTTMSYTSPPLPLATIQADFPFGDYTVTGNGASTQSATVTYAKDAFTAAVPALTGPSFTGLSTFDVANPYAVNFNSFTPDPAASEGFTFLTLYDASGPIFSAGFLAPSTTSVVIPANTLSGNTAYSFELDFSDRQDGFDGNVGTVVGSDVRTDGTFTTAALAQSVPEPAALTLLAPALLMLGLRRRS
jgi:hypothetical protein